MSRAQSSEFEKMGLNQKNSSDTEPFFWFGGFAVRLSATGQAAGNYSLFLVGGFAVRTPACGGAGMNGRRNEYGKCRNGRGWELDIRRL